MVFEELFSSEFYRELFNNAPSLVSAIKRTIDENAGLKKQVEEFVHEKVAVLRDKLLANAEEVDGVKVVRLEMEAAPDMVRNLAFQLRNALPEGLFFVAGTVNNGKPSLTVLLSDDLVQRGLNAVQIAREAAKEIQGGGGGQPNFAAAGGKNLQIPVDGPEADPGKFFPHHLVQFIGGRVTLELPQLIHDHFSLNGPA